MSVVFVVVVVVAVVIMLSTDFILLMRCLVGSMSHSTKCNPGVFFFFFFHKIKRCGIL